ncbi:MAG TPA: MBL fold metallo-hydrolase [Planctomycetota bacterium]|nr:MBL fold metallo-hydrolase [Planctomycetota bacterium]
MNFGDFEIHLLTDGTFKLDGGAMFGIVPKQLWTRERPADERNRMLLACNCPLIRTGKHNILIDCGLGRKWNEKQRDIYAIDERPRLIEELAAIGLKPSDITILIHTHLHLDHAGWNTQLNAKGEAEPVFVNARHVVERRELDVARKPNEIQRGTYLQENIAPIDVDTGWDTFEETREVVPGITLFRTGGHTAGHCAVRIESGGQRALFIGEMMPTTAHRHLPWIMAYDLFPLETLEMKRRLFKECAAANTLVLLNHDPTALAVKLKPSGEKLDAIKEI